MWDWNVERDEVYYNDQWRTSLGLDPQELLGARVVERSARCCPRTILRCSSASNSTFTARRRISKPNTRCRRKAASRNGSTPAQGRAPRRPPAAPLRVIGVLRDISAHKRNQRTRSKSSTAGSAPCTARPMACTTGISIQATSGMRRDSARSSATPESDFPDTFVAFQNILHPDDRALTLGKIRAHLENRTSARCALPRDDALRRRDLVPHARRG